jgi:hypothetical protein
MSAGIAKRISRLSSRAALAASTCGFGRFFRTTSAGQAGSMADAKKQISRQRNPNRIGIWNSKRQIDVVQGAMVELFRCSAAHRHRPASTQPPQDMTHAAEAFRRHRPAAAQPLQDMTHAAEAFRRHRPAAIHPVQE